MKRLITIVFFAAMMVACGSSSVAPNGDACELNDDCESDLCLTVLGKGDWALDLPDGICTNECDIYEQTGCTEEEVCLIYQVTNDQHCYQLCYSLDGCRDGWACTNIGSWSPVFACIPEPV